mgnify:CR=1 FL=1
MTSPTTTIRISRATHDKLRLAAYRSNRRITDIIDELTASFEEPSISEKISRELNNIK